MQITKTITGFVPKSETENETLLIGGLTQNLDLIELIARNPKGNFVLKTPDQALPSQLPLKAVEVTLTLTAKITEI